ncbi:hypothetical protein [uncultured Arcticibacterium sp.]|uniref:DUF6943 family protein n=1 Tax=uncultured Arcticibacterium sp. TaxID=2173042 RepID=UPI0030FBBD39
MQNLKIVTYNPKNVLPEHAICVLSKGLNSGKPLDGPTPNSFVIHASSNEQARLIKSICMGLWKTKSLYPYHVGSVIPFIRIADFKDVLQNAIEKALITENLAQKSMQIGKLEEMEKVYLSNLTLIQEAKKAIYLSFIRHKRK